MTNVVILLVGVAVIVVGYLLMSTGIPEDITSNEGVWNNSMAVTVAPLLLVLGYCVIIPIGIFYRKRTQDLDDAAEPDAATS